MNRSFRPLTCLPYFLTVVGAAGLCVVLSSAQAQQPGPKTNPGAKSSAAANRAAQNPAKTLGLSDQVQKLVHDALARNTFYKPGFLITRKDLEPVFSQLLESGITNIDSQEAVVDLVLAEGSQLAKLLKTPDGREFMKKLGNDPTVYDRLERMSWTYDGRRLIEKLIHSKDGPALLKSLQTPEQLAKFSKEIAADPRTKDFALPTGKAHTADQFIERMTELLREEASAE